jgi:hypothetical protein
MPTTPMFWNLSWSVIGDPADGTFYFNNQPNLLDQFLVNKNIAKQDATIRAKPDTLEILRFPGTFTGKYMPGHSAAWANPSTWTDTQTIFPIGLQVT